jgi:DNA-binding MarR family transcriptional regulator
MTDSEPPRASLAIGIGALFDALVRALHEALPAAGFPDIRPAHSVNVFRVIDPTGNRPTELARRAGVTPQAMAELVRFLEQRGYVERFSDPSDGRGRIVTLTDLGREASAVARRVFTDMERSWEETLGARRMAQLRVMLNELAGGTA